jgi:RNA polymerase sigma factor (sigma-70 family)
MPKLGLNGVVDWLRRCVLTDVPCGELLERFVSHAQDTGSPGRVSWGSKAEDAFAELVRRHGPKVYGVCRRILGDHQLAEDAFQATFVVLAKKAGTVRPRSAVGGFLYGVARKAALKASAMSRRRKEQLASRLPENACGEVFRESDALAMLDEEIANLSDSYRAAIVLCEIDGVSRAKAATQLGIPEGTLSSRLAAARQQLRKRLSKRGVAFTAGMLAVLAESAHAAVPVALTASTASMMASALPQTVSLIAHGVIRTMILTKLKAATTFGVALFLASGLGIGVLGARDGPGGARPAANPPAERQAEPALPQPQLVAAAQQLTPVAAQDNVQKGKGPPVYPLAVFNFEERGAGVKDYGAKVGDLLVARLATKPDLQLVDRVDIKKTIDELELGLSGAVKPSDATRVGQLTGAKMLVTGSVLQVDKKIYLIAKVIGTETSRVVASTVDGKATDELGPLVEQLSDKIAESIKEQGDKIAPKAPTREDRLANLKKQLKNAARPSVMVKIPERHVGPAVLDPAAQTELILLLKETGFDVLDPEEAARGQADILITGAGLSEFALRRGNLVSVKARVEIKATDRRSGKILVSDRQTALVVDLTENLAGKAALQEAAAILAERILPKLQAP